MRTFKLCLVGDYGVGKTSTIKRYVSNVFSDNYATTIGLNVSTKKVKIKWQEVKMVIWDIAGRDKFGSVEMTYLSGSDAILFVADGTREHTLKTVLNLRSDIIKTHENIITHLLINKFDLKHDWEISDARIDRLRKQGHQVFLTSAKDGILVNEAFSSVAEKMLLEPENKSFL